MPRVSLKHEDAMGQGFIQEGNLEIIKSVCAVHQFPPNSKTGEQSDPFPAVRWTVRKLNDDWSVNDEAETEVIAIRLGMLDNIRPGSLSNPTDMDEEPEDLGREVDTEGNSVFGEPGAKVGGNWAAMEESLRKCGFKPATIERVFMPDFDGMKFHVKTVKTGRKFPAKDGTEREATNLICDKIHTFPYDAKKKVGAKGKVVGKVEATGKTVTKPNAEPETSDAADIAKAVLSSPTDQFKKAIQPGKSVKRGVFQMQTQMELIRQKIDKDVISGILSILKDDEKLAELAGEVGFVVDFDEGTVTFP